MTLMSLLGECIEKGAERQKTDDVHFSQQSNAWGTEMVQVSTERYAEYKLWLRQNAAQNNMSTLYLSRLVEIAWLQGFHSKPSIEHLKMHLIENRFPEQTQRLFERIEALMARDWDAVEKFEAFVLPAIKILAPRRYTRNFDLVTFSIQMRRFVDLLEEKEPSHELYTSKFGYGEPDYDMLNFLLDLYETSTENFDLVLLQFHYFADHEDITKIAPNSIKTMRSYWDHFYDRRPRY